MSLLEEYENKTVLITGGAGCIGSNLSRRMAELNAEKVIILITYHQLIHGIFLKITI